MPTFLHVPSANLIPLFLQEGARRFIFEGRECGGHIGPLSSFVLWSAMVDRLTSELAKNTVPAGEIELLFAGGIHDAVSAAMVQVLVAPLVARGVKVGILMGSAYLFTEEIVASGAIVPQFQQEVIDCERTVNLESGPGHASRCAYTPFAQDFFRTRIEHRENGLPADESRAILDDLILGRLRIASKGRTRRGLDAELESLTRRRAAGRGHVHARPGGDPALAGDADRRAAPRGHGRRRGAAATPARRDRGTVLETDAPADVAIVGIGSVLPKANTSREYWQNILDKVDAIAEIPRDRWDWRLYFDADRTARDKIYSKWGGFLDEMPFDPMRYGMPPKSIPSIEPMQLLALEVARRDRGRGLPERPSIASATSVDPRRRRRRRRRRLAVRAALRAAALQRRRSPADGRPIGCPSGPRTPSPASCSTSSPAGSRTASTSAASTSPSTPPAARRWRRSTGRSPSWRRAAATWSSSAASTRSRTRSATSASARPRRCRRAAAADLRRVGRRDRHQRGLAMVALKRLADAERDGDRIYAVIKGVGGVSDGMPGA